MVTRPIVVIILLFAILRHGIAQRLATEQLHPFIVTMGIGAAYYRGDLTDPNDLIDRKPAISIGLKKHLTVRTGLRTEFSIFTISGNDVSSKNATHHIRNLSFESTNYQWSLLGTIDLLRSDSYNLDAPNFNFYAFAGVGFFYMNPKAELDGVTYALQPMETEWIRYSKVQATMPFGLGLSVALNADLSIGMEFTQNILFTDYLDDVSSHYPDDTDWDPIRARLSDRSEGMIFQPGQSRGDPSTNDGYYFFQLRINYVLHKPRE